MNIGQHSALFLIRGYQVLVSPALRFLFGPGAGCRFEPTCSVYAAEAVRARGVFRGAWLALRRLGRCHPWGGSGWDPVPALRPINSAEMLDRRECCRPHHR